MSQPYQSIFSYSITRPYPFRWFTPVVTVGFVAAAVLFSFLNLASNGYDLLVQQTADPNTTVSENVWFKRLPTYLTSRVSPSCQPANIPVNTKLFTNHTALTYTLSSVIQKDTEGSGKGTLPSLIYMRNPLTDCLISSIDIDLDALDRTANQIGYTEWGASVRAFISCVVETDEGNIGINLTAEYDYVPDTVPLASSFDFMGSGFLSRDKETSASLYWGQSLMSMYWVLLVEHMQDIRQNATNYGVTAIRKGTISMTQRSPDNETPSISDLAFFSVYYQFNIDDGQGGLTIIYPGTYGNSDSVAYLNGLDAYPNIWIPADSLAKSTYSAVLTDLGQVNAPHNILSSPDLLQNFTANFSSMTHRIANAIPGPLTQDYETLQNETGPLSITPSVISSTYICQVPQLKSTADLILAVLIADLVFLQALWKLFIFVVDKVLLRGHQNASNCAGHAVLEEMQGSRIRVQHISKGVRPDKNVVLYEPLAPGSTPRHMRFSSDPFYDSSHV